MTPTALRSDLQLVADMIHEGTRVLDIACGEGELLQYLSLKKGVDGRGIELSQKGVNACVERGLSVIQGDADSDLSDYPNGSFDYVILSQSLQVMRYPNVVLAEMLRIGRQGVVSFPNFAHWRNRWNLLCRGRMPVSRTLPLPWYDTPNIHFCTIQDFVELCNYMEVQIERVIAVDYFGRSNWMSHNVRIGNFFGEQAIFLLSRAKTKVFCD